MTKKLVRSSTHTASTEVIIIAENYFGYDYHCLEFEKTETKKNTMTKVSKIFHAHGFHDKIIIIII